MNIFTFLGKKRKPKQPKQPTVGQSVHPGMPGKSAPEILAEGMLNVRDIIAPSAVEVDFNSLKIGSNYYRTLFISGYPRFVGANWLAPVINFDHSLDLSMFYYPVKAKVILDDLRRKITELEATEMADREKGRITDPVVRAALEDAQALQEQLVKGVEKYFQFSFYITVSAESMEELETVTSRLESTLGSLLLISKPATLQMEEAFQSTLPAGSDKLLITRNMDTTSLATTFPFTSSDLTSDEGIMYGINMHNGSLVVFDRFSMENANTVVFAKSGAGKSYYVKLEALRMMIFGAEVMIIDPEEEYRTLCEAVGGNYIDFSPNSSSKINPFDLSGVIVEGENELGQKILSLHTLLKLMLGDMNPTEEAIIDRALIETYRIKGITTDPETQMTKEPPIMEDLYKVMQGMQEPEARGLSDRLEKYIKGSMAGIFDSQSSIDIDGIMSVFSTKNIEDEILRPVAFYIILDFVWTKIRRDLKKRILIVEEAWYLMQNEDSARFIYGVAKRARKYYLGLTTISQDVDDFLSSDYGKAIVTNSSIQILLKQHPAAIDRVAETFYLSEGERRLLLAADIGEGLFFAGTNHVAIKIKASPSEHKLITTDPEEILRLREEGIIQAKKAAQPKRPVYKPIPTFDSDKYETIDEKGEPKEPSVTIPGMPAKEPQQQTPPRASPQPSSPPPPAEMPPPPVTPPQPAEEPPPVEEPPQTSPTPPEAPETSVTPPPVDVPSPQQVPPAETEKPAPPPWVTPTPAPEEPAPVEPEAKGMAEAAAGIGIKIGGAAEAEGPTEESGIKKPEVVSQGGSKEIIKGTGGVMKKFGKGLGGLFGKKKVKESESPEVPTPPLSPAASSSSPDMLGSKNDNVLAPSMPPPPKSSKPGEGPVEEGPEGTFSLGGSQQGSI